MIYCIFAGFPGLVYRLNTYHQIAMMLPAIFDMLRGRSEDDSAMMWLSMTTIGSRLLAISFASKGFRKFPEASHRLIAAGDHKAKSLRRRRRRGGVEAQEVCVVPLYLAHHRRCQRQRWRRRAWRRARPWMLLLVEHKVDVKGPRPPADSLRWGL